MSVTIGHDVKPLRASSDMKSQEYRQFSPDQLIGWIFILDIGAVLLASLMAHATLSLLQRSIEAPHFLTTLVGTVIIVLEMKLFALYDIPLVSDRLRWVRLTITSISFAFLIILGSSFAYSAEVGFSRPWYLAWYFWSLTGVLGGRLLVWHRVKFLAVEGKLRRRVAIIGTGPQAERLLQTLGGNEIPWTQMIGVFDDRMERRSSARGHHEPVASEVVSDTVLLDALADAPAALKRAGTLRDLMVLCRQNMVDDVFIALPWSAEKRCLALMERLENLPVNIRMAPDLVNFSMPRINHDAMSGLPILDVAPHPLTGFWAPLKTLEDYILALILIVLLSPVLISVALAVKLTSPGPVFYRQPRYGLNNRIFHIYKFRSMYNQARPQAVTQQASRHDPRITPVGRFIRRTSLDELPQLLNIIEGSMSLVGPRPHAVDHNVFYGDQIRRYFVRHKVKPGITGWAQVNGFRGETDTPEKMQRRIEYDIEYIHKWSMMFDVIILARTALVVFFQKTAY